MANPAVALTGTVGDVIVVKSSQVDAYGGASSTAVVWSTSAAAVAVTQSIAGTNNAVVRCLTAGTATITATMGIITATFSLTVNAAGVGAGAKLVVSANEGAPNRTMQTQTS